MKVSVKKKDILVFGSAIVLGVTLYLLYDSFPIEEIVEGIQKLNTENIFLLGMVSTFIGNAGVLASLPYVPIVAFLSMSLTDPRVLVSFGFSCGIAAGLGETVCYGIGFFMRKKIDPASVKKFELLNLKLGKSKAFLVFLAGVSPIPDEFIIVPLASGKYPFPKTLFFNTIGKVCLGITVAFAAPTIVGRIVGSSVSFSLAAPLFLIFYYLFLRIDWEDHLLPPEKSMGCYGSS
ncbi:MAG: hypothetical protein GWO20_16305 [Candidatus Korarchaeota archaeon]|nr:hypothetical protein [Candidatus Korarchaeota archaeon]NIU84974.1 hypothetical protein [Candidatus Thorarchaeota archaeon]NIW14997.1 hypothetical protein [Candidatus Thorarchaeota archaeon]NIW53007.1 hypothetical protein [Candidatus Korarchaeota archaeon]